MENEFLELCKITASVFTGVASIVITVVGFYLSFKEYHKTKRDSTRSRIAKEAYALYFVEQQAMKRIAEKEGLTEQTVQRQLRDAAVKDAANELSLRPKLSGKNLQQYIID